MVEEYENALNVRNLNKLISKETQKPMVEEIYSPFVQNRIISTFSGTKYNSVTNIDPSQKFTLDLEHLR